MTEQRWQEPSEPVSPIALPDELRDFLRRQGPYACLTMPTTLGTAYVLKAPAQEIDSARGTTPIHIQHLLYEHRNAPVIRTLLTIYDQPEHPLRMESFINELARWLKKAWDASQAGTIVVCLAPARTDTAQFHRYCMKGDIFFRGRIRALSCTSPAAAATR